MKFSIVTISYNQRKFIERAICSVVSQQGVEIDYVVVDAGSADGSRELIRTYASKIATMIFERDDGPADGLNKGFAAARGDIFGYINSDDYYLPGAFREVADYFAAHPDVGVITGHGFVVDEAGRPTRRFRSPPFSLYRFAYGYSYVMQQSTFFRRSAFERSGGFNVANRTSWDGELVLDMARKGEKIAVLESYLSAFSIYPGSITGSGAGLAESRKNWDRYFETIMGRTRAPRDRLLGYAALASKYLADPRNAVVRACDVLVGPPDLPANLHSA
jgi:glycosyltransferase involved in cell wall biosynthesis